MILILGIEIMRIYNLDSITGVLRHLCICFFIVIVSSNQSWSSPMCQINTSVSHFKHGSEHRPGISTDEVFAGHRESNPFRVFVREIESALLAMVSGKLCLGKAANPPVSVEMRFVELYLIASTAEIDQIKSELANMKGSYADVRMDMKKRTVQAKIVWNPRRMLRDRLLLEDWDFDEEIPLLPFYRPEIASFVEAFERQVILAPSREIEEQRISGFRGALPDDMFALIVGSSFTDRMPFGHAVGATITELIDSSLPGYTEVTRYALTQAFKSELSTPIISINDIEQSDIRSLYQRDKWSYSNRPKRYRELKR